MTTKPTTPEYTAEVEDLRVRLAEAEETLSAIRNGKVDAVLVAGDHADRRVYILSGADRVYRMLIETMSEGAATLSADKVIMYCNARLAQMLGRPLDQVLGTELRDYLPPADQSTLDVVLAQVQTVPIRREISMQAGDGHLVPVYLSASRLPADEAESVFCLVLTDMTEQKSNERILASELRYRRLFESAKDGILILDAETGMVVDVNPFLVKLLGFSREEFLGKAIWELGFFKDIFANHEKFLELQQQKYIRYEDKPLQTAEGRRVDVEFVSNVYLVNQQKVIQCNIRNITERKRVEQALRESEERFRTASENLMDVIFDWDIKEKVDWFGDIDGVMGYPRGEFPRTMKAWVAAIHPEDKDRVMAALEGHLKGTAPFAIEYRVKRRDGQWRWWSARGTALRDERGAPYKMIGSVTDITTRKQVEEGLLAIEEEFRSLAESMPQIVWITRPDGWNIYFNQQWVDYTGLTLEESYGHGWNTPFHPDDKERAWDAWQRATQHNDPYSVECRLRRADGAYRWWLIRGVPVRNLSGEIVKWFGTCTDIEDIKRAEKVLRETRDAAESANRAKSTFLSSMSHELRTPLNSVIGFSEVLADKTFGELNEKQGKYVDNVLEAGRYLLSLINDILDLAKVESGKMELELSTFPLAAALNNSLVMVKEKCMKQGIALSVDIKESLQDIEISADERKLKQILFNLLSNAVKFTPDGGSITVSAGMEGERSEIGGQKSEIRNRQPARNAAHSVAGGSAILISVADTGIGIKPEDQERIFRGFEQVDSSYTRRHQGTGLGLKLVKQFVELHGGRVWVESVFGKGSTFWFTIPVVE